MPGQPRYPDFRFPFHGSPCGKRASLPCQKTFSGGRSVSPGVLLCRKAGEKAIPFLTREAPVMPRSVWNTSGASSRRKSGQARPPFGWTRHPLAEAFLRASLVADHTAPHPGGGAAPSCARGRPFCSGGVGGCSASARRPSSRSRSRSFARWPFPIRKAALPWGRAAFIIFFERCLSGGALARCPAGTGGRENPAGKAAEPRLSGEPADRAGRLRRDCPGGRGDWTPGRFGRATPPCSKTA